MADIYSNQPWLANYDRHVPPALTYEKKTFAELFRDAVAKYPDRVALYYLGAELTFRDLDLLSNRLAAYLIRCGLKPNDVVGLHMPNIPAHYISIVAVQKAGCVSTGLSPLLTPQEMEHQLRDSGTKLILTVDVLYEKICEVGSNAGFTHVVVSEIADFLPALKQKLGKLLKKIPTAPVSPMPGKTVVRFTEAIAGMPDNPVLVPRAWDDMIFMMYTGGTTGPSKGAMLTQKSVLSNRQQALTWLDFDANDLGLSAFPLFHIAGLFFGVCILTTGITQVCVPNPRDAHFITEMMKKYRPHFTANVPTVYFELIKLKAFRSIDHSRLKWAMSAAMPMPAETIRELESIIGENKFIELYGMTETSPVTCCNPRHGKKKASSIGMPMPDTEFKLIDPETGMPAKQGEPGEIAIRGPQVMMGYFRKPEETKHAVRDGWMYTGDVAYMDTDGYFYIVDRVKDMVIVSGFKVFTKELDDVLSKHPSVAVAASIGVPDPKRPGSERVACAIVLRPGIEKSDAEKDRILAYLKEQVAPYKVPKVIEFMDELPTSGVGKVLKRELRKIMGGMLT